MFQPFWLFLNFNSGNVILFAIAVTGRFHQWSIKWFWDTHSVKLSLQCTTNFRGDSEKKYASTSKGSGHTHVIIEILGTWEICLLCVKFFRQMDIRHLTFTNSSDKRYSTQYNGGRTGTPWYLPWEKDKITDPLICVLHSIMSLAVRLIRAIDLVQQPLWCCTK